MKELIILAAEGGEVEHSPIIPLWQELVLGSIAFALICFVLMKFVFPRMEETFRARVDAIEGGIKRALARTSCRMPSASARASSRMRAASVRASAS